MRHGGAPTLSRHPRHSKLPRVFLGEPARAFPEFSEFSSCHTGPVGYQSADPQKRERQLANLRRGHVPSESEGRSPKSRPAPVALGPLTVEARAWAADRWPWLDDTRLALIAVLAARVRRVELWAQRNDVIFHPRKERASVHPIIDSCDKWEARLATMIEKLDREARERRREDPLSLEAIVAEYAEAS